ncbi:hypothetical protein, partial [Aeromonas veronii]|uniref:hypothetical protein n=1 Tax=Aeromonas veronii TaxID=654 RepID=UPI003D213F27
PQQARTATGIVKWKSGLIELDCQLTTGVICTRPQQARTATGIVKWKFRPNKLDCRLTTR